MRSKRALDIYLEIDDDHMSGSGVVNMCSKFRVVNFEVNM